MLHISDPKLEKFLELSGLLIKLKEKWSSAYLYGKMDFDDFSSLLNENDTDAMERYLGNFLAQNEILTLKKNLLIYESTLNTNGIHSQSRAMPFMGAAPLPPTAITTPQSLTSSKSGYQPSTNLLNLSGSNLRPSNISFSSIYERTLPDDNRLNVFGPRFSTSNSTPGSYRPPTSFRPLPRPLDSLYPVVTSASEVPLNRGGNAAQQRGNQPLSASIRYECKICRPDLCCWIVECPHDPKKRQGIQTGRAATGVDTGATPHPASFPDEEVRPM